MKLILKRLLIIVNFSVLGFLFGNQAFAAYHHHESTTHGFNVEAENYNIYWYKKVELEVYEHGVEKGVVTFYIGTATSKAKLSNGKTTTTIMIRAIVTPKKYTYNKKFLWWDQKITEYGIIDELKVYAQFYDTDLLDVTPKNNPTSNSYTVGISGDSDGFGISASRTFTQDALTITNLSRTSDNYAGTRFKYNQSSFRGDWQKNSYAFYESEQAMAYTLETKYKIHYIVVYARFNSVDTTPGWYQDRLYKYSSREFGIPVYGY